MNSLKTLLVSLYFACALFAQPLHQIVILGDPHLPGKRMDNKESVLHTINQWKEVDAVVAIGDLCSQTGTQEEYAQVKEYFSKLTHPLYPITGNHDFIYEDTLDENGKLKHASLEIQKQKRERFQQTFGLSKLYYSIEKEPYLLIFLSADTHAYLSGISDVQALWFEEELKKYPKKPTIVFFHAPLNHTLESYKHWVNTPSFVAQPIEKIQSILKVHPQVFLWVSGHTHTSPLEKSFASAINLYEGHVTNIHNSDMNKETIWTNSLLLYSDKVMVKTYNHATQKWENSLERTFIKPTF
jgi:3',5'-cyclic-AMP phosphodiesterase